jgi:hypothetical protein
MVRESSVDISGPLSGSDSLGFMPGIQNPSGALKFKRFALTGWIVKAVNT